MSSMENLGYWSPFILLSSEFFSSKPGFLGKEWIRMQRWEGACATHCLLSSTRGPWFLQALVHPCPPGILNTHLPAWFCCPLKFCISLILSVPNHLGSSYICFIILCYKTTISFQFFRRCKSVSFHAMMFYNLYISLPQKAFKNWQFAYICAWKCLHYLTGFFFPFSPLHFFL